MIGYPFDATNACIATVMWRYLAGWFFIPSRTYDSLRG